MAYNSLDYNCTDDGCSDLSAYDETIESCGAVGRLGGAATVYLLLCGNYINDPGSVSEWDAKVLAGGAIRISNVKMGMGQPTAITADPTTSCGTTRVINYTRTIQLEDFKVSPVNSYFWSQAAKRDFEGLMFIECPTSGLTPVVSFVNADITLSEYRDLPNTNENLQKYVVEFSWKDIDSPIQYNLD